jgi:hypothetical protein
MAVQKKAGASLTGRRKPLLVQQQQVWYISR